MASSSYSRLSEPNYNWNLNSVQCLRRAGSMFYETGVFETNGFDQQIVNLKNIKLTTNIAVICRNGDVYFIDTSLNNSITN